MKPPKQHILTVNGGSSSIKFSLYETEGSLKRIMSGGIERIGMPDATWHAKGVSQEDNFSRSVKAPNHKVAVRGLMNWIEKRHDTLTAVGHRDLVGRPPRPARGTGRRRGHLGGRHRAAELVRGGDEVGHAEESYWPGCP